jgi:hypothetical protein
MRSINLLLLLIAFILVGCVQVPMNSERRASNLAVTSVRDAPIKFTPGSRYSISPQHFDKVSSKAGEIRNIYQDYAKEIRNNLNNYGYQEVQDANSAEFHVKFALALSEDLDDKTINKKFGITPGLQESKGLNKGSMLISITDAKTQRRIWHGAIQGFVQEEATEQEREQRREYVINMVLTQFYH